MKTLKILFCFLLLNLLPASFYAQEALPVIDMHMHIGVPMNIPPGAPAPCLPHPCEGKGKATSGPQENMQKTLEMMEKYNVVLGFLGDLKLEELSKWDAAAPDRFILSPFILDPEKTDIDLIRKKLESGEFEGIGEIGAQLEGIPPNDPRLEPFFALAEEFDVPVLIHTAGIGPPLPDFRSEAGNPLLLEDVLTKHPDLRIFVENSGFPYLDDMVSMMYQYPQLYGDISTITWIISRRGFYDYLEELIQAGLGKRLMFGSDQMVWPEMIGEGIEAIENADFLTEEEKRDILYNNAARFLKLQDE